MNTATRIGILYLVPAPLDFGCDTQTPLQDVLPEGTLRGHAFHHSQCETAWPVLVQAERPDGRPGEPVWRKQRLTASYFHFYFPSNPEATASLFDPAKPAR